MKISYFFSCLACLAFSFLPMQVRALNQEWRAGSYYTVDDGEGAYRVAKILVLDKSGVHIRLYKNKWNERPKKIDPAALTLGSIRDSDGFGMGHLPLSSKSWAAWSPQLVGPGTVSEEELEGYKLWQEGAGGNVFGDG